MTEVNHIARLAFREHHRHRTALLWQELVWTDSTALGPDHSCNRHNAGLWVEKGEAVPLLQKFDVRIINVAATSQPHDMG